uniref:Uncharacterized protein n=1 Tax=Salix viminalis TaxID=40686 RepID=A0A6N2LSB7_SALVM
MVKIIWGTNTKIRLDREKKNPQNDDPRLYIIDKLLSSSFLALSSALALQIIIKIFFFFFLELLHKTLKQISLAAPILQA